MILLGGTLQPFPYMISQLLPTVPTDRLRTFSCGHVVAPESVCSLVVPVDSRGDRLEINHRTRLLPETCAQLLTSLIRVSAAVPRGMVVFLTSYAYMDALLEAWRKSGQLTQLQKHKRIFVEPRAAAELETTWAAYCKYVTTPVSTAVPSSTQVGAHSQSRSAPVPQLSSQEKTSSHGGVLFCVMGGKLSEGINFSDDLARCVVVIGMPYPDGRDPILQLKLEHANSLDTKARMSGKASTAETTVTDLNDTEPSCCGSSNSGNGGSSGSSRSSSGYDTSNRKILLTSMIGYGGLHDSQQAQSSSVDAGKTLYDALCMKVVNQSIGRSIRHAADYAAIVLLDARYSQPRIRQQLPGWVADRTISCRSVGDAIDELTVFFDRTAAGTAAVS